MSACCPSCSGKFLRSIIPDWNKPHSGLLFDPMRLCTQHSGCDAILFSNFGSAILSSQLSILSLELSSPPSRIRDNQLTKGTLYRPVTTGYHPVICLLIDDDPILPTISFSFSSPLSHSLDLSFSRLSVISKMDLPQSHHPILYSALTVGVIQLLPECPRNFCRKQRRGGCLQYIKLTFKKLWHLLDPRYAAQSKKT